LSRSLAGLLYLALDRRERWLTAAGAQLTSWIGSPAPGEITGELRVLIIDDDPQDLERLRSVIEASPLVEVTVDEARSVQQGRAAILQRLHDVILVGHELPGGSGLDLIHELHPVASGPMIFITKVSDATLDQMALAKVEPRPPDQARDRSVVDRPHSSLRGGQLAGRARSVPYQAVVFRDRHRGPGRTFPDHPGRRFARGQHGPRVDLRGRFGRGSPCNRRSRSV
jgi:CheY-like chemotaxis protein